MPKLDIVVGRGTITGVGFTQALGVGFGDNVLAQFTVNSDTEVTATVPVDRSRLVNSLSRNGGETLARVEQTLSRRVPAIAATFGRP